MSKSMLEEITGEQNAIGMMAEKKMKHDKEIMEEEIEFQRLCYEIFHESDDGKKLYDIILKRYIIPCRFSPIEANASLLCMYWEGFKTAMRGLYDNGKIHSDRLKNNK